MGYRQKPWKDSFKMMKWQGFEQEDYLKSFSVMIQKNFPTIMFCHKGVDDIHSEVGEKEICKEATWFKIMLGSVIPPKAITKRIQW
jgi:hypothetical protein